MAFQVRRTPQARRRVEQDMDGTARASYEAARDDLRGRGCEAGGYRMAATDGGDYPLCGRHLAYDWRMYSAYPDGQSVVIVAIERHRAPRSGCPAGGDSSRAGHRRTTLQRQATVLRGSENTTIAER